MKIPFYFLMLALAVMACEAPQNDSAEDSSAESTLPQKEAPIRGVWLTNVASEVLDSREAIAQAMDSLAAYGFNTVYVVTWNRAHTLYPSAVMDSLFGKTIDQRFAGRDPLQEVIEEGHKRGLKVYAWFEFGFSSSYDSGGGYILEQKPQWAARDIDGNVATKNKFNWMNALHPEVQDFLISLVTEVVQNYEVDGVQGDDRLPAMPNLAGYSDYTRELYAEEHSSAEVPNNHLDYEFVKWRSHKLSLFMKDLYQSVKEVDPDCIVSSSPSIFPWSEENYLQDWPTWLRQGWVDEVIPQCYRYDLEAYEKLLVDITEWQVGEGDLAKVYPGMLIQVADHLASPELLDGMMDLNRQYGFEGEVSFFYEGVEDLSDTFKKYYAGAVPSE